MDVVARVRHGEGQPLGPGRIEDEATVAVRRQSGLRLDHLDARRDADAAAVVDNAAGNRGLCGGGSGKDRQQDRHGHAEKRGSHRSLHPGLVWFRLEGARRRARRFGSLRRYDPDQVQRV